MSVEKYLKPEVINQIKRLDLRAQFVVKGFLQGLHASPFHGFSVEFSEHRKYTHGDDPQDIDWLVFAKTDKYYVKKFEAETNITGYLVMDLSRSMGYTYRQTLAIFEFGEGLPIGVAHGAAEIHHQVPGDVRLRFEFFNVILVGLGEDEPIDVLRIIAVRVLAMLAELDRE